MASRTGLTTALKTTKPPLPRRSRVKGCLRAARPRPGYQARTNITAESARGSKPQLRHADDVARIKLGNGLVDSFKKGTIRSDLVVRNGNEKDGERECLEILLVADVLVSHAPLPELV